MAIVSTVRAKVTSHALAARRNGPTAVLIHPRNNPNTVEERYIDLWHNLNG